MFLEDFYTLKVPICHAFKTFYRAAEKMSIRIFPSSIWFRGFNGSLAYQYSSKAGTILFFTGLSPELHSFSFLSLILLALGSHSS